MYGDRTPICPDCGQAGVVTPISWKDFLRTERRDRIRELKGKMESW